MPGSRKCCPPSRRAAFTLMELLVVIGIIGLLTAIALPRLSTMKRTDIMAAANRQLLDDIALARQRAIAGRTTVYMLFMPPVDPARDYSALLSTAEDRTTLLANQQTAYALYAPRTVGDQPGRATPRYLTPWRSLPEGLFIPTNKFFGPPLKEVSVFQYTTNIPLPSLDGARGVYVPYLAFDYLGRLQTDQQDEVIPLARGGVFYRRDGNGDLAWAPVDAVEKPFGNSVDNYNHIRIDWLTGRANVERPSIP